MKNPKFPMSLPRIDRKSKSPAQDLAFGREELASALRFLADQPVADDLRRALAALPPATVMSLGCRDCNGDVPLDQPDLVEDRICRQCADAYDHAAAERWKVIRQARLDRKRAA